MQRSIALVAFFALLRSINVESAGDGPSGSCAGPCELHPAFHSRIQKDVEWLDRIGGITDAMIRNISLVCDSKVRHQCNTKVVRMMIKDGELYLNSMHPEWRLGPPEFPGFLLELYETSKLYRLPDLEFAYNGDDDASSPVFDWEDRSKLRPVFHGGPFPLLSWSKGDDSFAQLVPYSGAFRCTEDSFDNILLRLEEIQRIKWREKRPVAFGRWNEFCATYQYHMPALPSGELFECPRSWLPKLFPQLGDMMDVAVVGDKQGQKRAVPLQHQNAFKFLVSTDGWAISSKFDKYLLLGSAIIKAASSRFGYYYDALEPGKHYLNCMNRSKDDIKDVIRWLVDHDDEAARIAQAAQTFAVQHLHRGARLCYYRTLIEEMGKRMRYKPDCSNRKLCLPVGRFLEFLSTHPQTRHTCRYAELLTRYPPVPANPSDIARWSQFSADEAISRLHKDEKYFPRDTDIVPLDREPYFPGGDA